MLCQNIPTIDSEYKPHDFFEDISLKGKQSEELRGRQGGSPFKQIQNEILSSRTSW